MVAILEDPEIRRMVRSMSVEEYEEFGERAGRTRTELIRGIIIEKISSSPDHSFLIEQLVELAREAAKPDAYCRQEQPLKLRDSVPEPDLAVVAGRGADYRRAHPTTALLVIEVAVSSLGLDRAKAALYAEAGVEEYWIVLAGDEAVEVYAAPQDGTYTQRRLHTRPDTLVSAALPALRVALATLFPG